jgi:hypothetical protein
VDAGRTSDQARALPLSEAIPSYKTNDECVDGHDIDGGPMREVEIHVGFLVASFPHPQ